MRYRELEADRIESEALIAAGRREIDAHSFDVPHDSWQVVSVIRIRGRRCARRGGDIRMNATHLGLCRRRFAVNLCQEDGGKMELREIDMISPRVRLLENATCADV